MTYLQTIILAIIEGFTEFLPISSTGHLLLAQKFLGIVSTDFTKSFDIIIQLSAIIAVVFLFRKKILNSKRLWWQLFIAFLPTGILGLLFYKIVKGFFMENIIVTIVALLVGGVILLIVDNLSKLNKGTKSIQKLSKGNLLSVGLIQSLSMIPGVSRSAASIVGGLISGLSRTEAVEFSFLLAIPTMIVATGYDLLKNGFSFSSNEYVLLGIGSIFSFLSSMLAIKAFTSYVAKHNFTVFAIYRIILAVFLLIFLVLN